MGTPHSPSRTPHKHAELIKAWADGAEIQYRSPSDDSWVNTQKPLWETGNEYRIKPKTIKYRVALVNNRHAIYTVTYNEELYAKSAETSRYFIKWLSDWQEVEV